MAHHLSFRPETGEIPKAPGVYRWYDKNGRVIYVGKAKNLRARLTSYFGDPEKLHERTRRMVLSAANLDWTIVNTEFEALQLEFTWIKEFNPPFNVQFKDDKSYPYLAITMSEEVPRVFVTRHRHGKGTRFFGPYTQAWTIRETVDTMLSAFPIRSCGKAVYRAAELNNRPCLLGDIGKCSAPCVGRISKPEHKALAKQFGDFIAYGDNRHIEALRDKMNAAAESEQFELAAKYRDNVTALETVLAKSAVVLADETDADLFGLQEDELSAAVSLFRVRGGRIRGMRGWVIDKELERSTGELVEYLLQEVYGPKSNVEAEDIPREVLVPALPEDFDSVSEWLSQRKGGKVQLRVPQRGDKANLFETANKNAAHALMLYKSRRSKDFTARAEALGGLQRALRLENAPLRIECFDVSHLGGTNVVASMVVFEDGLPKKDQYRKFNIEGANDDTESIYQVLTRRLRHLKEPDEPLGKFSYRPSLLIVDGGQPQVNAAARALRDSGIGDIAVCGIAKRLEEVWMPGSDYPLILPRASDELFLIQHVRDEAHRFAIEFQRAKRKSSIASALEEIPGLGDKRVAALLRHFGSLKRLKLATVEEISDVNGIGPELARTISQSLNS